MGSCMRPSPPVQKIERIKHNIETFRSKDLAIIIVETDSRVNRLMHAFLKI